MKDLVENNLIRFTNIVRKKNGIHANFRVKGIKKRGDPFSFDFCGYHCSRIASWRFSRKNRRRVRTAWSKRI